MQLGYKEIQINYRNATHTPSKILSPKATAKIQKIHYKI